MQRESRDCICPPGTPACICGHAASIRLVNRKIITPTPEEVERNPRSRSARLRAAERIIASDPLPGEDRAYFNTARSPWWDGPGREENKTAFIAA
jgi:16S rRNA (cytosine1402-N4)-methyltransferase